MNPPATKEPGIEADPVLAPESGESGLLRFTLLRGISGWSSEQLPEPSRIFGAKKSFSTFDLKLKKSEKKIEKKF